MFTIAGAKIILDFYGNGALNEKRAELKKLFAEVRKQFDVSIAEVADFHDPERCVLGLSLVAADEADGRKKMKRVLEHIDQGSFARVVSEDSEYFGML